MSIKVGIDYDPAIRGTRIWIVDERPDGMRAYKALGMEEKIVSYAEEIEPTFVFGRQEGHDFLQELSNALVRAGFKPDELKAHSKEVDAMKYHLEDMRKLAFEKKK